MISICLEFEEYKSFEDLYEEYRDFFHRLIINKIYILKVFIQFFNETSRKATSLLINLIKVYF